ncbi:hypothetical protein QR685DRAFT_527407 [Neurospora intermedia]|uniref:Uncharacterized protein n=1 Tax=Neurospora intermedia TaxID=5142 RepID=A0ABR3DCY1_NEUIN
MREMIQGLSFLLQAVAEGELVSVVTRGQRTGKQAASTFQGSRHGWDMSGGYTCGGRISDRTRCTDQPVGVRHEGEGVCTLKQEELSESRLAGAGLRCISFLPRPAG